MAAWQLEDCSNPRVQHGATLSFWGPSDLHVAAFKEGIYSSKGWAWRRLVPGTSAENERRFAVCGHGPKWLETPLLQGLEAKQSEVNAKREELSRGEAGVKATKSKNSSCPSLSERCMFLEMVPPSLRPSDVVLTWTFLHDFSTKADVARKVHFGEMLSPRLSS